MYQVLSIVLCLSLLWLVFGLVKPAKAAPFLKTPGRLKVVLVWCAAALVLGAGLQATMPADERAKIEAQKAEQAAQAAAEARQAEAAALAAAGFNGADDARVKAIVGAFDKTIDDVQVNGSILHVACYRENEIKPMFQWVYDSLPGILGGVMKTPGADRFQAVRVALYVLAVDQYGKQSKERVLAATWPMEVLKKVQWDNKDWAGYGFNFLPLLRHENLVIGPVRDVVADFCDSDEDLRQSFCRAAGY